MRFIQSVPFTLLIFPAVALADITEQSMLADCAKIPAYASKGKSYYNAKNYPLARQAFEEQVRWSEGCLLSERAIATAYNNVALTLMRQGEWRKARAWLMLRPEDARSVYNLGLIKDKLAALPKPVSASGEYWSYAGLASWQTISIKPWQKKSDYYIDFSGYSFGAMGLYYGPNTGDFSEKVTFKNNKGVITLKEEGIDIRCDISLVISPESIDVTTDVPDNCGFGHNVSADGYYWRVE